MALRIDELRRKIGRRHLEWAQWPGAEAPVLSVQVEFDGPLDAELREALHREAEQASHTPIAGSIEPRFVEVAADRAVLYLDPVHPGALRLDQLLAVLPSAALDGALAATIVGTIAQVLDNVHRQPGVDGVPRTHLEVHPRSVLLTPGGALALIGSGLPALTALLVVDPAQEADRYRPLSPEAARGEAVDGRADVYALGALYYQLLSGRPYRQSATATALCTLAIEGAPPELPGSLVAARPTLLRLLGRALAPEQEDRPQSALAFLEEIAAELEGAGLSPSPPAALARLIEGVPPLGTIVGPMALLAPAAAPALRPTPLRAQPIADDLALAAPPPQAPPSTDAWSQVLGDQAPTAPAPTPMADGLRLTQAPGVQALPPSPRPVPSGPQRLTLPGVQAPKAGSAPPTPTAPVVPLEGLGALAEVSPSTRDLRPKPKAAGASKLGYLLAILVLVLAGSVLVYARSRPPEPVAPPDEDQAYEDEEEAPEPETLPPTAPDGGARARKERLRDAPQPLGLLTVNSRPSGATVELDGGYVGTTPLVLRHAFAPRPYVVTVMAEGHRRWQRTLQPDAKLMTINVMATLEKE